MAQIIFTIDNGKIQRIKDALAGLYPIPQINEGTEDEPDMQPEFTKSEWAKECTRRWIIRQVARFEYKTTIDAVVYNEEDDLVT